MVMGLAKRRRSQFILPAVFLAFLFLAFQRTLDLGSDNSLLSTAHKPLQFKASSVDWASAHLFFPPNSITPLPTGQSKALPQVQASEILFLDDQVTRDRRDAVKTVFSRSWKAYKEQAWTWDEIQPVTGGGKNTFGGWAATLVDSLDTLWIMGQYDDFYQAAQVAVELDWANTTETAANLFETTIRHLGGLLSAYDLSGENALLLKAKELGDMLYMAFDTPNGMPGFWIDWNRARTGQQVAGTFDPSASPSSLCLEFTRLAQLTGEDKYWSAIDRVREFLYRTQDESLLPGMWPRQINFQKQTVNDDSQFTLGALADSLYEYLPKMYILTGGLAETYETMYRKAMNTVTQHILFRPMLPSQTDILFSGDVFVREDGRIDRNFETQHLGCFTGGMFLLGGQILSIDAHVRTGEKLARGCAWAYDAFPTGLMPEIAGILACPGLESCEWDEKRWAEEGDQELAKGFRHAREPKYILRPEAIESIFYLYRATAQEELRDIAWNMFQNVVKATETGLAYSAIKDVKAKYETEKEDSMESFWMAETLKYFYLIFSPPDLITLDEWVLNTEAHPFRHPSKSLMGKAVTEFRSPRHCPVRNPSSSMCSLLASRHNVFRGGSSSTRVTRPWRQASIHFWHYIRQEFPHGQAKLLNYEDLAVPDIESQEISLWSEKRHLGLVPVKEVINDYLSPGMMLSLRGDPPTKKSRAVPESYDYEVRRIKASTSPGFKRGRVNVPLGAKSLYLDAFTHPFRLMHLMDGFYRFLDTTRGPAKIPVEFHLKARPLPGLTGLSLFTWGRVDLHPAVILRAMPEGAFQVLRPKVDLKGGDALWVIAPKDLQIGSVELPKYPHEVASMVEKVVVKKREWLKELIDAGDMTPSGKLTVKGQLNPRQKFGLNKQCLEARGRGEENEEPKDPMMDKDEFSTDFTRLL